MRADPAALLALGGVAAWGAWVAAAGSPYDMRVFALAGVYALAALGFLPIFGHAGALALSQGTFMGLGAYASGIAAVRWGLPFDAALPLAIGVPVLLAAAAGLPALRLQTHYFALATLLLGQIAQLAATDWMGLTGGANGVAGIPGLSLLGMAVPRGRPALLLVWAMVALGAAALALALRGRTRARFALMRAEPTAAACAGIDTGRLRFSAFLASAGFAGAAGAIAAHLNGVVSPEAFGLGPMVTILTIAVIGGRRSIAGVVAGAVLAVELPEWFRAAREAYLLAYGAALLLTVVLLPEGIVPALARLFPARDGPLPAPADTPTPPGGAALRVERVWQRFGGVAALSDVSLAAAPGEAVGLIGPNGSGKTTLVNAVSGVAPAQAGDVWLDGRTIAHLPTHRLARAGLARTFQRPALAPDLSALDNVALAVRSPWRMARATALALLAMLDADGVAATPCGTLPHAARRRVEVARALALAPRLLLLDEPAAGLDEDERAALRTTLRRLADGGLTMLVVEHDLAFLDGVTKRLVCLDAGRVIADGTAGAVRADPRVRAAYLGE